MSNILDEIERRLRAASPVAITVADLINSWLGDNGYTGTLGQRLANWAHDNGIQIRMVEVELDVPGVPTNIIATAGAGSATIEYSIPNSNGSDITHFIATSIPGGFTGQSSSSTDTVIVVEGLDDGTEYTFEVRAFNALGASAAGTSNAVTPVDVPDAPVITLVEAGDGQVVISGTAPDDHGSAIILYTATASPSGQTAVGGSLPLLMTGLVNGTPQTVTMVATNGVGTSEASAASDSFTPVRVPENSIPPEITGTLTVGNTLTCSTGTWLGDPAPTFAYQWKLWDGDSFEAIVGETVSTYSPTAGGTYSCSVTGTNIGGSSTVDVLSAVEVDANAPANTVAPTIDGLTAVGSTLTVTPGTWTGDPAPVLSYQWQREIDAVWTNIASATATTHVAVVSGKYHCVETATNTGGTLSAISDEHEIVEAPSNTVLPSISGTPNVGETLTVVPGEWDGYPVPALTYQWQTKTGTGEATAADVQAIFDASDNGLWYDPSDAAYGFQDTAGVTAMAVGTSVVHRLDKHLGAISTETTEKVNNGAGTNVTGWTTSAATLTTDGTEFTLTTSSSGGRAEQTLGSITAGKLYKITGTVRKGTAGNATIKLIRGSAGSFATVSQQAITATTDTAVSFYAFSDGTDLVLQMTATGTTGTAFFKNVSVKEVKGNNTAQQTSTLRPLYADTAGVKWIDYDGVDDAHTVTFTGSLGSDCTVIRYNSDGTLTTLTGQTVGATLTINTDDAGLFIIDRALTAEEQETIEVYYGVTAASGEWEDVVGATLSTFVPTLEVEHRVVETATNSVSAVSANSAEVLIGEDIPDNPGTGYRVYRYYPLSTWGTPVQTGTFGIRATVGGANLSGTLSASSTLNSLTGVVNVADGDVNTYHQFETDDTGQYIEIELSANQTLAQYVIGYPTTEAEMDSSSPRSWEIRGSDLTRASWTVVDSVTEETRFNQGEERTYIP